MCVDAMVRVRVRACALVQQGGKGGARRREGSGGRASVVAGRRDTMGVSGGDGALG